MQNFDIMNPLKITKLQKNLPQKIHDKEYATFNPFRFKMPGYLFLIHFHRPISWNTVTYWARKLSNVDNILHERLNFYWFWSCTNTYYQLIRKKTDLKRLTPVLLGPVNYWEFEEIDSTSTQTLNYWGIPLGTKLQATYHHPYIVALLNRPPAST